MMLKYIRKLIWLNEIDVIANSTRKNEYPALTIHEKAVIYKYSDDGYKDINEDLRKSKGKTLSEFGTLLNEALSKLPDFEGLVYRKVYLTRGELNLYKTHYLSADSCR